jgi:RNA polymerase sigma-70 factor (ECF subfamily)
MIFRRRKMRTEVEAVSARPEQVMPKEPHGRAVGHALESLVLALPLKERACVLLKEVFKYSLEETAVLVGSTVGGVKAAFNRGRSKLMRPPA